jgi:hypothetical protein
LIVIGTGPSGPKPLSTTPEIVSVPFADEQVTSPLSRAAPCPWPQSEPV